MTDYTISPDWVKLEDRQMRRIFSGDHSVEMWDAINNAKTKEELRRALYLVCCRLQELEAKIWEQRSANGKL
jgi:hypothetical protein